MSWLTALVGALSALARLAADIAAALRERRLRQAGEDRTRAAALREQMHRVEKARTARRVVDTGRLPDRDPYARD